jgi:ferritin-like metal-binding protein YciE
MEMEALRDLYVDELKDLRSAEKQILRTLPRMIKAATARGLKQGFSGKQTREHVRRLERIFQSLEQSPRGKKCVGMTGLLEEAPS